MDQEPTGWQPELEELRERQRIAREMGGPERIRRQHDAGKLTVRERIDRLIDPASFLELGSIAGKATYDASSRVMTDFMPANGVFGRAAIDGRPVVIFGDDFTVRGGSADDGIDQGQIPNAGAYGRRVPPAADSHDRGLGWRRVGENHRNDRPRQFARRRRTKFRLMVVRVEHGPRSRCRARPRLSVAVILGAARLGRELTTR